MLFYDVCDIIGKKFRGGFKEFYLLDVCNYIYVDYKYIKVIFGVFNICEFNIVDNIYLLYDILSYYMIYVFIVWFKCVCSMIYIFIVWYVSGRFVLFFLVGLIMFSFMVKFWFLLEMMGYGSLFDEYLM